VSKAFQKYYTTVLLTKFVPILTNNWQIPNALISLKLAITEGNRASFVNREILRI
jgi:hypothetical protein